MEADGAASADSGETFSKEPEPCGCSHDGGSKGNQEELGSKDLGGGVSRKTAAKARPRALSPMRRKPKPAIDWLEMIVEARLLYHSHLARACDEEQSERNLQVSGDLLAMVCAAGPEHAEARILAAKVSKALEFSQQRAEVYELNRLKGLQETSRFEAYVARKASRLFGERAGCTSAPQVSMRECSSPLLLLCGRRPSFWLASMASEPLARRKDASRLCNVSSDEWTDSRGRMRGTERPALSPKASNELAFEATRRFERFDHPGMRCLVPAAVLRLEGPPWEATVGAYAEDTLVWISLSATGGSPAVPYRVHISDATRWLAPEPTPECSLDTSYSDQSASSDIADGMRS